MKEDLSLASRTHPEGISLRDSVIQLLIAKLSDDSRISRIIEKLRVSYSHVDAYDLEKALEPLLCLDPAWLYRLVRDCNEQTNGLSTESGLCQFKKILHSLITRMITSEVSPEILESGQVKDYASLAFSKLAGTKRKLRLDEELLSFIEDKFRALGNSADSANKNSSLLPAHLNRSIDCSKAYLIATLAKAENNSQFRSQVGLDVIRAGYSPLKLSRNFPDLQTIPTGELIKSALNRSRIISRIVEEAITRYLRDSKMNENSLHELSEYMSQITDLQDAKSQASGLRKSMVSLRSDMAIIESEKSDLIQEILRVREQHSDELEALRSQMLSSERCNSVENAELGQKIRSVLIESRRRIDSEMKKLDLLLQEPAGDAPNSKQRLVSRIRNVINDLEVKILEVIS